MVIRCLHHKGVGTGNYITFLVLKYDRKLVKPISGDHVGFNLKIQVGFELEIPLKEVN